MKKPKNTLTREQTRIERRAKRLYALAVCLLLAMTAMILGAGSNILLDYVFMYPLNLGIRGAAMATALGPIFSVLILLPHFLGRRGELYFAPCPLRRRWLSDAGGILVCGVPSFVMEFSIGIVTFLYNFAIARWGYGELGLAAYLVIGYLMLIILTLFLGMAEGLQPVFSRFMATGERERGLAMRRFSTGAFLGVGLVSCLLVFTCSRWFFLAFAPEDPELIAFAVDRAGLVGSDGETHQGIFDLSYLSTIPNMSILAPKNKWELSDMVKFAVNFGHPIAIRYPRGQAYDGLKEHRGKIIYGKSEVIYWKNLSGELPAGSLNAEPVQKRNMAGEPPAGPLNENAVQAGRLTVGSPSVGIALLAVGSMVKTAEEVWQKLKNEYQCTLVNVRFVKPMDTELLDLLAGEHDLLVTLEENVLSGGFGEHAARYLENCRCLNFSGLSEKLQEKNDSEREQPCRARILNIAIPDTFVEHGNVEVLRKELGIDSESVIKRISEVMKSDYRKA